MISTLVTLIATVSAVFIPVSAKATVAPSFATTPSASTVLNNADSITASTTLPVAPNSTLDAIMQQTWPAGRAQVQGVTAPTGWGVQYQVGSTWTNSLPNDTRTVSGVRANATALQTGAASGNGLRTSASVTSTELVADASQINSSGRGDGWDVFLSPHYILNVYHHDWQYRLECHDRSTGNLCGPLYTVPDIYTSNGSSGTYYQGKVYSFVQSNNNASVICTNVTSFPFSSCGITDISAGLGDAQGGLSTQTFDGTHIWAADLMQGTRLCYNVVSNASCGAVSINGLSAGGNNIPGFFTKIGTRLYLNANKVFCWNFDGSTCSGTWPATRTGANADANLIPSYASGTSNINGVCTYAGTLDCLALNGSSLAMPAGLTSIATAPSTAFRGGYGYFQTTAFVGTKVYWASNPSGNNWDAGRATCYDWSIDAACAGFSTSTDIGLRRYAFTVDSSNPTCIWTNGDDGSISNFDGTTGQLGCPVTTIRGISEFNGLPRYGCSPITGIISSFAGVTFVGPGSFDETILRVTVIGADGLPISGYESLQPNSSGFIDLSSLSSLTTGASVRFILDAAGITSAVAAAIDTVMSYNVEPFQLCVNLSSFAVSCPQSLTGLTSITQSDFAIVSNASYSVGGTVAQQNSDTKNFSFNAAPVSSCFVWHGFLGANSNGVDTSGNRAQVENVIFGADGKMYVGGLFAGAGGDSSANNLAVWDGTNWSAIGAVPVLDGQGQPVLDGQGHPTFTPAINDRVTGLAFAPNGDLLVVGDFTDAGGVAAADYFAIYKPSTNTWSAAPVTFNQRIRSIAVDSATGMVYVGGIFNGRVSQLDSKHGYAATMIGQVLSSNVLVVKLAPDGTLYAGGQFRDSYGHFISKWNGTAWVPVSADANIDSYINNYVWDIAFSGNKIYVVGLFSGAAQIDTTSDTVSWLGGTRAPSGSARGVAVAANGDVYVAGAFTSANGVTVNRATKFDGTNWIGFMDGLTGSLELPVNRSPYDWRGAWEVTISPSGQAIFAGNFEGAAGHQGYNFIAYFGPSPLDLSAVSTQNVAPAPYFYLGPLITKLNPRVSPVAGGDQLTITGRKLAEVASVTLGGKPARIISKSESSVVVEIPANTVGMAKLVFTSTDGVITFVNAVDYQDAPAVFSLPVQTTGKITGFKPDRAEVPALQNAVIRALLSGASPASTLICVGQSSSATVNRVALAVAKARAANVCAIAQKIVPGLKVEVRQTTGLGTGQVFRNVVLKLSR